MKVDEAVSSLCQSLTLLTQPVSLSQACWGEGCESGGEGVRVEGKGVRVEGRM